MLQPDSGRPVVAAIEPTGAYKLSAPAGEYRLAVVSSRGIPEGVDPWKANVKLPPPFVPDKYGDTETSGERITVLASSSTDQALDIALR